MSCSYYWIWVIHRVKDTGIGDVKKEFMKVSRRAQNDPFHINPLFRVREFALDSNGNSLYQNANSNALIGVDKKTHTHISIADHIGEVQPCIVCSVRRSFYLPFLNHVYEKTSVNRSRYGRG